MLRYSILFSFFILDHVKVSTQELHTILYVDCTKLGVLNQSEINMVGTVAEKILSQNPHRPLDRSSVLQYPCRKDMSHTLEYNVHHACLITCIPRKKHTNLRFNSDPDATAPCGS